MITLGNVVRVGAKSGRPLGPVGSTGVNAIRQGPQNSRNCQQHGTWSGFWQLAALHGVSDLHGLLFAAGYKSRALSHFLNCRGLPEGLAFALHFNLPRKCLQCAWYEPSSQVFFGSGRSTGHQWWT
jgi:hypothetical protein